MLWRYLSLLVAIMLAACTNADFGARSTTNKAVKAGDDAGGTDTNNNSDLGGRGSDSGDDDDDGDSADGDDDDDGNNGDDDDDHAADMQEAEDKGLDKVDLEDGDDTVKGFRCSTVYTVPGTASPYFAGSPSTASLGYNFSKGNKTDTAISAKPIEVIALTDSCFKEGARIYFEVSGSISHGSDVGSSGADGSGYAGHQLGAQLGKSDIKAPMNSLLGVFIGDGDPADKSPPSGLKFETDSEKNYEKISPKLGQIFFIGDGKQNGDNQLVVVPKGTKRLFFGVMDSGQWNNNSGALTGAIIWRP